MTFKSDNNRWEAYYLEAKKKVFIICKDTILRIIKIMELLLYLGLPTI